MATGNKREANVNALSAPRAATARQQRATHFNHTDKNLNENSNTTRSPATRGTAAAPDNAARNTTRSAANVHAPGHLLALKVAEKA